MRPTLIIDADDTLWEYEVYYAQSTEAFTDLMVAQGFALSNVSRTVDSVQRERVALVGYAPQEFARNLVIAYERLCQGDGVAVDKDVSRAAWEIGCQVIGRPVEPFDGVEETLVWLSSRFRLLVLTRGDQQTQESKLVRSGLSHLFESIHVVREKGPDVIRELVERHGMDPGQTWMVGNSPRADINPALAAGIGAVFVPYARTWDLDREEIASPARVIKLESFRGLMDVFCGYEETPG